ncbi:Aldo/keto reductase [Tilletiaria anomala UBC 951]|uniref:Aldo/keto reductase n=1 Tax=Tilletiaria anomala (strain ATCC 24038 / CBS 436.72 / UBC 951) TaxID=1037660 RepID=A0A066WHH8_TILAU|nr:Aldo/keto reductase [Tilletiaria anomala UBC 951]KDN53442.1 Aldo/keto reductase [Tilletiaria anomala UBC 951]
MTSSNGHSNGNGINKPPDRRERSSSSPSPGLSEKLSPLSHGPLPANLSELPNDTMLHGNHPAPWVETWKSLFLTSSAASEDRKVARVRHTDDCAWATVQNVAPIHAGSQGYGEQVNEKQHNKKGTPPQAGISPLIFGAGTFGTGQYSSDDLMMSIEPVRALRIAFRYGINTFDTSPYYANSETILGRALSVLAPEFPRSTYYISTKAGRYGPKTSDFDYTPQRVRRSVCESIVRLNMQLDHDGWLDNVYMHDVEFVCTRVGKAHDAGMGAADVVGLGSDVLSAEEQEALRTDMGLAETFEAASKVHGEGDEKILGAVRELFKLKDEGKIKMAGISGYPLPVLLRLARMVATNPPFRPLDSILSYSNHTLHSDLLPAYIMLFECNPFRFPGAPTEAAAGTEWTPPFIMNASPFSMGLLTEAGPPPWHPCSEQLRLARQESLRLLSGTGTLSGFDIGQGESNADAASSSNRTSDSARQSRLSTPTSLAETALQYGIRGSERRADPSSYQAQRWGSHVPHLRTLVGLANVEQVHIAVQAFRTLLAGAPAQRAQGETVNGARDLVCPPAEENHHEATPAAENEPTFAQRYELLHEAEEAVVSIMKTRGVLGESWQSPGDHLSVK